MSCTENWVCSTWTTTGSGSNAGTRTCTDQNACGTTKSKPAETATLPALDLNFFKCNVQPIFDQKCSMQACHGTETGRALKIYARGRLRNTEVIPANVVNCTQAQTNMMPLQLDTCSGSLEGACRSCSHTATEWQRGYDSARGFALDANLQRIAAGMEDTSELIAQAIVGGKVHTNVHLFKAGDPEQTTLRQWLSGMTLATCTTID